MSTVTKYGLCMGRNYDYEKSYKEQLVKIPETEDNWGIIGICAGMVEDYPLLYDGMNSQGLCVAGLAFTGNAAYNKPLPDKNNVPAYDFTKYFLSNFRSVTAIKTFLRNGNITNEQYSPELPNPDLHWFICDKRDEIIVEQTNDGLKVYDAETKTMTNNPPYPLMMNAYEVSKPFIDREGIKLDPRYETRGLETENLDGSYTSDGRFIRVSYLKSKMAAGTMGYVFKTVPQTFHLLNAAEQVYGVTRVGDKWEYTIYSIVYDMRNLGVHVRKYTDPCPKSYDFDEVVGRIDI